MLVTRPISADLDFLDLHRLAPSRYPMLLESAAHGTAQGRWDLLLATSGEALSLHADGSLHGGDGSAAQPDFLDALDNQGKLDADLRAQARLSSSDPFGKALRRPDRTRGICRLRRLDERGGDST